MRCPSVQVTTVSPTYAADALGGGGGTLRSVLGRKDVRAKFRVMNCTRNLVLHGLRLYHSHFSRLLLGGHFSAYSRSQLEGDFLPRRES